MPTNLRAGQVAIVGYNAEDTNSPNKDTISFILLTPILNGTQIFFTDRAWNGSTFAVAGGNDGTYTYTAGADLPAGTVIQITTSQLGGVGIDLNDTGETIYVYQGAINAPTTFLFAADIADGNNTFNGSLTNTGLSVASNTAVAIAFDNASFAARGHDINTPVLLDSIADSNDWTGNDNSMQVAPQGSLFNAPDQEIWVAASGGGNALIRMDRDGASFTAEDIMHLMQNSSVDDGGNVTHRLWHPTDIVFDTVHNKVFVADSDGSGHNRIVQFNISDFLNNPGVAPAGTILYQDAGVGVGMVGIQVDINTSHIYFGEDTHIYRLNYDTGGQTPGIVAYLGTNVFVQDFVLDLDVNGNGSAYIVNSSITSSFGTDNITRNFLYQVTGITPTSTIATPTTVNATQMAMEDNDQDITGVVSTNLDPEAFPKEYGNIKGIDLDPVTHILYFTTGTWSADHDGNSGTPPVTEFGGIWSYATIGNAVGHYASVFRQDGVNGPDGLLYYVEVDHATGKYYISDITGGPGVAADDQDMWVGNIAGGTPTQFGFAANIQGLTGLGMSIQTAPTLGGTNLNPGQTEQANSPSPNGDSPAPPVVTPANAFTASDLDTIGAAGGDNVAGAQVRISNNFLSNAVAGDDHQDILSLSSFTTGSSTNGTVVLGGDTISFVYDASTGTMTFSGISTFANYQTVLATVRFQATGDNPTGFGAAGTRTISYSTFDGLLYSDEVHATVTITGLNDTPINNGLGGSYTVNEDVNLALTGISVFDVDSDPASQNIVVTLSVAHGTLTILTNVAGGITAGQISAGANNSATMTLTATQNQINTTLAAVSGLTFVPTADYNGSDSITVVTNDQGLNGNDPGLTGTGSNEQDSDSKTINITAVPDIVNDARSVAEDSGANNFSGANSLLANDTFENPTRFISAVTQGTHGSVSINNNGTAGDATDDFVVYTVTDANYNGSDSFTYTVTSPAGVTEVATVNVTVTAVNDPVSGAAPVSTSLSEDSVNFAVTGLSIADVDTALAPAGVYNVTLSSTHGTMTLTTLTGLTFTAGDGTSDATMTFHGTLAAINTALATATYTPTANYNGTDAAGIVLQVTDTFGGIVATGTGAATSDTDNISVTVTPVNDAPAFAGLNGTPTFVEAGAAVVLDNNATATDIDLTATNYAGASLTLARSGAASAQDVFGTSGTLSFSGTDVLVGATMVGTFTQAGGTLAITFNSNATQALVNSTLQQLTYSNNSDNPPASAVIAYVFSDGNSGVQGPGGPLSTNGSVTVTITPTNDAPTAILSNHTLGPATEQVAFDLKNQGLSVSDIDGNSGSETVTLAVGQGVLNVTAGTSGAGVSGSGTATVTITGTIAQINALLNTDGTSTVSYLNSSDAPATSTSLSLTIHDNGATGGGDLSASDSGTISITAVNDGPVNTKPGTQTINEDATLTFSGGTAISVNDPDVGAGNLTVTLSVVNGQLTLSGTAGLSFSGGSDGTDDTTMTFTGTQAAVNAALAGLLYETTQDFNGSDTLTITTDDNGNTGTPGALQDVDTVTINITAVADIANDSVTVGEDSGANNLDGTGNPVSLLANDSFENAGRTITSVTQGLHGTVTIDENGNGPGSDDFAVYTPNADYYGADSFTYTVTSGGVTETATVNVTVTAAADIADDSATTNEDVPVSVLVLGNDTFDATPAITNVGAAAHGTAVLNDNGTSGDTTDDYIVYTPNADYNGTDSFTYTVTSGGVTETATVNMTIDPVADIVADSVFVTQDSGVTPLDLLANDNFESAARFISAVGSALHGTTAISNNGTPGNTADDFVTYMPTAGYGGPDSFTYTVTSGGVTETVSVSVNVGPPNAPPVVDLDTGTAGIDATATFVEGNGPVALGPTIDVSDVEGDMIQGATIAISDPEAGDILIANLPFPGGITIDLGSSTADFMVLTGSATAADYAAALGQIGFDNTGNDPTVGGTHTTRSIGVTVSDAIHPSAPATSTVTLFGTNDEPTLAATGDNPVYTENSPGVVLFSAVTASTVEANQTLTSLTLTVTNVTDGASELLGIDGSIVALTDGNAVTTSSHGLGVSVSLSGSTATVTFSGAALSGADVQTLVGNLTYANSSENPTDADRLVTITELVDSGSNTAPNDNIATLSIGSTVNVNPVNDAAIITGDVAGNVTEAGGIGNATPGTPTATGDLDSTDVDNMADAWQVVAPGGATANGYGTYALDAAGVWVYTLDDNNGAVQALNGAATLTDTFNALTADGTAQLVTITIHAQDDAPTSQPDAISTDEATSLFGNVLNNNGSGPDSDPDSGGVITVSEVNGSAANVGVQITLASGAHLTLNANGSFAYDPNHAFDATPGAFSGASNLTSPDSFTYTLAGGNSTTVTVTITGLDTNDTLLGTPGSDTLRGGVGADSMTAGAGNDIYFVDNPGDSVFELDNEGLDIVFSSISYALTAGAHVELLSTDSIAGTTAITLYGNELSSMIWGNNGDNVLRGGGGGDDLYGFGGNDVYFVDDVRDRVLEDQNKGSDAVFASVSYTLTAGSYVELLSTASIAGTAAINLTGNELGSAIWGNNGDNILSGGGGGDDMVGFGGNDTYHVSDASDRVLEGLNGGNDTVFTSVSYMLTAGSYVELLQTDSIAGTNSINLNGNELSNTIWGNNGDNVIRGGGGGDTMAGFGGNDVYFLSDVSDSVIEAQNGGSDAVFTTFSYTLTAGSYVELLSTVSIAGTDAINLTGNELGNTIWGNNGVNTLNGGLGTDALIGFGGADTFAFTTAIGNGNGNVDTIFDFASGTDKIALDDAIFGGLSLGAIPASAFHIGATATDDDQRILYDDTTGDLYYDADGSGAGAAILFATLRDHPTLVANDFQVI